MTTQTIAIVGATGNQGGSVLKTFASSGKYKVRALTRNPNGEAATNLKTKYPGVEWVKADLNDINSLRKAFSGAYAVFGVTQPADPQLTNLIMAGDYEAELSQGKNIIDAAIAERVKVAVMSTLESIAKESKGKYTKCLNVENKYKIGHYLDSKLDQIKGVNVYQGAFMGNYTKFARVSPEDNETIEFTYPLNPTTLLPLVNAVNDTGPVVMYALEHANKYQGKPLVISGGLYRAEYMAKAFAEATGKPARYVQVPHEVAGVEELVQMLQAVDEFGYFSDYDFEGQNKHINHRFVTPVEFWKTCGWEGPSS